MAKTRRKKPKRDIVKKAEKILEDDGFGKSTQKIGKKINEDPNVVGTRLGMSSKFEKVGSYKGNAVYMLKSEMSNEMERWTK